MFSASAAVQTYNVVRLVMSTNCVVTPIDLWKLASRSVQYFQEITFMSKRSSWKCLWQQLYYRTDYVGLFVFCQSILKELQDQPLSLPLQTSLQLLHESMVYISTLSCTLFERIHTYQHSWSRWVYSLNLEDDLRTLEKAIEWFRKRFEYVRMCWMEGRGGPPRSEDRESRISTDPVPTAPGLSSSVRGTNCSEDVTGTFDMGEMNAERTMLLELPIPKDEFFT